MSIEYHKLVRDRIPEIIKNSGKTPVTRIADNDEYKKGLEEKLSEEVTEFLASSEPEELADILEVVLALANLQGIDKEQLENIREKKVAERGGFTERIILEKVEA